MGSVEDVNRERSRLVRRAGRVRDARTLARPCYLCDAPAGERCIDISRGHERPPHKMRMRAARAALVALAVLVAGAWNGRCGHPEPSVMIDCSLDAEPFGPCPNLVQNDDGVTGTLRYDAIAEGLHELTIRARRLCGSAGPTGRSYTPETTASYVWDHDPAEVAEWRFQLDKPGRC